MKKFIWIDNWYIEEQAAWLSHMALQGWKLTKIGMFFATFEHCEPKQMTYRFDIYQLTSQSKIKWIESYEKSGWEHVGSRGAVQIFREKDNVETHEVLSDGEQLVRTVSLLKKDIMLRWLLILIQSIVVVVMMFVMLTGPVHIFLNDSLIAVVGVLFIMSLILFNMTLGLIHVSKLLKKVKSGYIFERKVNYKRKKKWKIVEVLIISVTLVIGLLLFLDKSIFAMPQAWLISIPEQELPIVYLKDTIDESKYIEIINNEGRGGFFTEKSSLLVPHYDQIIQRVEVPNVTWSDNRGTYTPVIFSEGYQARNVWVAKMLMNAVKKEYITDNYFFEYDEDSEFDELVINRRPSNIGFVARKGRFVYQVKYSGMEPIERIIELTLEKVPSE
ncbi:DUF2812 domain-containing protein [Bacillus solimangrovi]|uniref:DUF2812 domain-containing protein n=1 Tax=Bacillus solimangrovi TaxID=1305675 RepID=A0A1E5LIG5_9BACI|nr:DUF2812 domain-containing protein [Bacillus solimangrovi]OEH93865.1 hypothetical protein BFG57_11130 [Bacillus solimangrovi]